MRKVVIHLITSIMGMCNLCFTLVRFGDEYEENETDDNGSCDGVVEQYGVFTGTTIPNPNVTSLNELKSSSPMNFDINNLKWKHLLTPEERTSLNVVRHMSNYIKPCERDDSSYAGTDWNKVMLVEGAYYHRRGVFRSNYNCIMRYHEYVQQKVRNRILRTFMPPFCAVCRDAIWKKLTREQHGYRFWPD